jgi:hypothetical protein
MDGIKVQIAYGSAGTADTGDYDSVLPLQSDIFNGLA